MAPTVVAPKTESLHFVLTSQSEHVQADSTINATTSDRCSATSFAANASTMTQRKKDTTNSAGMTSGTSTRQMRGEQLAGGQFSIPRVQDLGSTSKNDFTCAHIIHAKRAINHPNMDGCLCRYMYKKSQSGHQSRSRNLRAQQQPQAERRRNFQA